MNALTAIAVVVILGAVALAAAAWITARTRIGVFKTIPGNDPSKPSQAAAELPESARKFRVFGWVLAVFLYLLAVFCLLQGLNDLRVVHHWALWKAAFGGTLSDRAEIALYVRFWIAMAIVFVAVAYWTQWRLRRRAAGIVPASDGKPVTSRSSG